MRIFFFIVTLLITILLCFIFDKTVPLGRLLSPQHGIWQNAESAGTDFSTEIKSPELNGSANVYFDERLIPHVFATNDHDAYFIQGYLHAKFRLFQMELQTMAAAGRLSEFVGDVAVNHDREFRRLGMVFGAENSLREMEKDPVVKAACDAYTAGVNSYIRTLTKSQFPLEYKLLDIAPAQWSNFKTALFLKYMSNNLAGYEEDFEMSSARNFFSTADFNFLFPAMQDSLDPIIPTGTPHTASTVLRPPVDYDTLDKTESLFQGEIIPAVKPDRNNGSNNWAVAGSKTATGAPILANDPHLGLNLPAIWYEMQISTPSYNTYGVSFPGAPSIIIGYNDQIAWGVTNGGRDVRDYYKIQFRDASRREYLFDSVWKQTEFRLEEIKVKGGKSVYDTVAYTLFGPVMYDESFNRKNFNGNAGNYAVTWTGHKAGKELLTFMLLNRAKNYDDYLTAVENMHTPGQNFVFASKAGDIALRTQGEWPAKWKGQGDYIMPGIDSTFMWQAMIPMNEIPYQYNPTRAFVSSANQRPVDSAYPYYMGRHYPVHRGVIINRMLTAMQGITVSDMMRMQTDNYNVFGEWGQPVLVKNISLEGLSEQERSYYNELANWDFKNDTASAGATIFQVTWDSLFSLIYKDEYATAPEHILRPTKTTLLESLLKDSAYKFIDDIQTTQVESLQQLATSAFKRAVNEIQSNNVAHWAKFKDTRVIHLLRLQPLSRLHLPIGGGEYSINATKEQHGPSWRMVVSLTANTEAYGVYPGGQHGNPGSRFYDSFIDQWAYGKYYKLWMMRAQDANDSRVKWTITYNKQ